MFIDYLKETNLGYTHPPFKEYMPTKVRSEKWIDEPSLKPSKFIANSSQSPCEQVQRTKFRRHSGNDPTCESLIDFD